MSENKKTYDRLSYSHGAKSRRIRKAKSLRCQDGVGAEITSVPFLCNFNQSFSKSIVANHHHHHLQYSNMFYLMIVNPSGKHGWSKWYIFDESYCITMEWDQVDTITTTTTWERQCEDIWFMLHFINHKMFSAKWHWLSVTCGPQKSSRQFLSHT